LKLDEESGNATDVHGGNTFTDNGGVGSGAGNLNNCRDFDSVDDYFSRADDDGNSFGSIDWEMVLWFNSDNINNQRYICGKYTFPADTSFLVESAGFGNLTFRVSHNGAVTVGGGSTDVVKSGLVSSTWYMLDIYHDNAAEIGVSINNGSFTTAPHAGGTWPGSSQFQIGASDGGTNKFAGLIDEFRFWKRLLTPVERTTLHGGGTPPGYDSFAGGVAIPVFMYQYRQRRVG
jgi:hypothetical protein